MSKTSTPDYKTKQLNKAVEKVFLQMDAFRHKTAMLGAPIRGLTLSVDEENECHYKVRYFKIPKAKKVIERMAK